jgi:hypothetical protein
LFALLSRAWTDLRGHQLVTWRRKVDPEIPWENHRCWK